MLKEHPKSQANSGLVQIWSCRVVRGLIGAVSAVQYLHETGHVSCLPGPAYRAFH